MRVWVYVGLEGLADGEKVFLTLFNHFQVSALISAIHTQKCRTTAQNVS